MNPWIIALATLLGCLPPVHAGAPAAAKLRVAALHPLMADLARQVGGDQVIVHDLVGEGSNPHRFEPRPKDMEQMHGSSLILAAGMGLEPYLDRIRDTLGGGKLLEVGASLPPLAVCGSGGCGHEHHSGHIDPHWWHSIDRMSRASRVVATRLGRLDPANASHYLDHARAYRKELSELQRWAKLELARVPAGQRKLVTAHHAFGYFADEFDFEVIAIAGLNAEQGTSPQQRAALIEQVRNSAVRVIFPEQFTSNKVLESVSRESGTRLGSALISDGNGRGDAAGFTGMIRHNVTAIAEALATP